MKLFVVRHGETKENRKGILMGHNHGTLTKKGKEQAQEARKILSSVNLDHIYSSDLSRCVDTVKVIAEKHANSPLELKGELRERNMGEFQGMNYENVDWDSLPGSFEERKPKGGESIKDLNIRIRGFLKKTTSKHNEDTVLMVTHAGVIAHIIAIITGREPEEIFKGYPIVNGGVIKLSVGNDLRGKIENISE